MFFVKAYIQQQLPFSLPLSLCLQIVGGVISENTVRNVTVQIMRPAILLESVTAPPSQGTQEISARMVSSVNQHGILFSHVWDIPHRQPTQQEIVNFQSHTTFSRITTFFF